MPTNIWRVGVRRMCGQALFSGALPTPTILWFCTVTREDKTERNKCSSGPMPERKWENKLDTDVTKAAEPRWNLLAKLLNDLLPKWKQSHQKLEVQLRGRQTQLKTKQLSVQHTRVFMLRTAVHARRGVTPALSDTHSKAVTPFRAQKARTKTFETLFPNFFSCHELNIHCSTKTATWIRTLPKKKFLFFHCVSAMAKLLLDRRNGSKVKFLLLGIQNFKASWHQQKKVKSRWLYSQQKMPYIWFFYSVKKIIAVLQLPAGACLRKWP